MTHENRCSEIVVAHFSANLLSEIPQANRVGFVSKNPQNVVDQPGNGDRATAGTFIALLFINHTEWLMVIFPGLCVPSFV
jgi:hypothetical protein